MKETDPRETSSSRRDAIGLLAMAATFVPGAMLASSARAATWAGAAVSAPGVPHDLAQLAADHFEPLVGETFTVGNSAVTLKTVRRGRKSGARFRDQFSVVFQAPHDLSIDSAPLPVSHPAVGRHDLLVTRIGNGAPSTALEVCFG